MTRIVLLFACLLMLSACVHKLFTHSNKPKTSKSLGKILKSKDNEYKYKMAEQYYEEKNYSSAQQLYEDLFPYIKGTDRYELMYYKVAFCYYNQKDYLNAENYFKTFTETFPNSSKSEECEYMRAYTYYKQSPKVDLDQTNTSKTIGLMQAFINTHPASVKVKEANDIIDLCRQKLEQKEFNNAQLYYNLGYFRAAAISFGTVSENFPDSKRGDEYKLQVIRSYYKYAEQSIEDKQPERFGKVITECSEFAERYTDSKLLPEVIKIKNQTNIYLKNLKK